MCVCVYVGGGGGGGGFDGDDQRILGVWNSIFDYYFFGGFCLSRDFMRFYEVIKTILGLVVVPAYPGIVVLQVKYKQTCF